MAKKKKAEEHENLERWLVSYADFMTLLFATFVVLYALAQTDVNTYKALEDSLRQAFTQSIFESQPSVMDGSSSIFEGKDGQTNPLMLEYMSQKYEQTSYEEIKEEIGNLKEEGVSAAIDDRGLIIRFSDKAIKFKPASAEIEEQSKKVLNDVGRIIKSKFSIHYIQVEGHSDSDNLSSNMYPSNWELSSARASSVVRFLIKYNNFNPKLFSAVGLADTAPIVKNDTPANKAKNRRVEVIVLKNKFRDLNKKDLQKIMNEVKNQQKAILGKSFPLDVDEFIESDKNLLKNAVDMTEQYSNETERLDKLESDDYIFDGVKPDFMEIYDDKK